MRPEFSYQLGKKTKIFTIQIPLNEKKNRRIIKDKPRLAFYDKYLATFSRCNCKKWALLSDERIEDDIY